MHKVKKICCWNNNNDEEETFENNDSNDSQAELKLVIPQDSLKKDTSSYKTFKNNCHFRFPDLQQSLSSNSDKF